MSTPGRQIYAVPTWALSGTAEAVEPAQATRDAGLAIDGRYPYQTANWLYRTMGENLGELRDRCIFSDILVGFKTETVCGTTGAGFTNVKVCTGDAFGSGISYFVAGLNTSASAYEVYGYSAGAPTLYSNGLPVALVINDLCGDTSGSNKVMVVGSSGSLGKAYRASAANTWTDVTATLFSGVTAALRSIVRMNLFGANGNGDYSAILGDAGQVFIGGGGGAGFNLNSGWSKVTPPTGMAAVNFRGAAPGTSGANYRLFFYGDSRHVMRYAFPTTTEISNALPTSVSSVNAATCLDNTDYIIVGGSRTDGRAFLAYSTDQSVTFTEIDPDVHGITSPITKMRTTGQGGLLAVAGGVLWGGHVDDCTPWKNLTSLSNLTDVVLHGNNDRQLGAEADIVQPLQGTQVIVGIAGTTPGRVALDKSRWITGGRTMF